MSSTSDAARWVASQFLGVSGYWFTGSARGALGSPKFGGDSTFYVRPAHRNNMLITGGIEIVGATDHWQPLSGGNQFSLTGASFRVSGERRLMRLDPFVTAGVFAGHIHSVRESFSDTTVVPSAALGADFQVHRYITLTARYRVSGHIHGVNTDGFSLGIRFF